jgi:hypothetical protein
MLKPPAPRAEIAHRLDIAIGGQQLGAHLEAIRADDHVDRARRASARSEFLAVGDRARHQLEVELETRGAGASAAPDRARAHHDHPPWRCCARSAAPASSSSCAQRTSWRIDGADRRDVDPSP